MYLLCWIWLDFIICPAIRLNSYHKLKGTFAIVQLNTNIRENVAKDKEQWHRKLMNQWSDLIEQVLVSVSVSHPFDMCFFVCYLASSTLHAVQWWQNVKKKLNKYNYRSLYSKI